MRAANENASWGRLLPVGNSYGAEFPRDEYLRETAADVVRTILETATPEEKTFLPRVFIHRGAWNRTPHTDGVIVIENSRVPRLLNFLRLRVWKLPGVRLLAPNANGNLPAHLRVSERWKETR